jgi:hypothetical protein
MESHAASLLSGCILRILLIKLYLVKLKDGKGRRDNCICKGIGSQREIFELL